MQHQAIIPVLKKSLLDLGELKIRSISNLLLMSKEVEQLISEQFTGFLNDNNLMPYLKSACHCQHSTETALLRTISDLLDAVVGRSDTLLGLLHRLMVSCVDFRGNMDLMGQHCSERGHY